VTEITKQLIRKLEVTEGRVLDLGRELLNWSTDIISKTGFGYDLNLIEDKAPPVGVALASLLQSAVNPVAFIPVLCSMYKWYHRRHFELVDKVIFATIQEKTSELRDRGEGVEPRPNDILDLLLSPNDEVTLTKEEIRDETLHFFLAGNETTGLTIMWTLYLLYQNPKCLERLVQEIDSVLRNPDDPTAVLRDPTTEDFCRFQYLVMVLKETLRYRPPAPFVSRETPQDIKLDGHTIKKGVSRTPRFFQPTHRLTRSISANCIDTVLFDPPRPHSLEGSRSIRS